MKVFFTLIFSIVLLGLGAQEVSDNWQLLIGKRNLEASLALEHSIAARKERVFTPDTDREKELVLTLAQKIKGAATRYQFNGDVLVTYQDRIVHYGAYGLANPATGAPLAPGQRYQLASVSKQFTAAAILILAGEGKLDLDAAVASYLPEFKFKGIRVRHLLNHSSGLPDYLWYLEHTWKKESAPANQDILPLINRYFETAFRPGKGYLYSNTGYALLALLIEKRSGMSYADFLSQNIFMPLQMEQTSVQATAEHGLEGYKIKKGEGPCAASYSIANHIYGDKGIYATASDLNKWFIGLKNGLIVQPEYLEMMFYPDNYMHKSRGYGMGFKMEWSRFSQVKIYHNGLWEGFRNGISWFPDTDLQVIVLSHTSVKAKNIFEDYVQETGLKFSEKLKIQPKRKEKKQSISASL